MERHREIPGPGRGAIGRQGATDVGRRPLFLTARSTPARIDHFGDFSISLDRDLPWAAQAHHMDIAGKGFRKVIARTGCMLLTLCNDRQSFGHGVDQPHHGYGRAVQKWEMGDPGFSARGRQTPCHARDADSRNRGAWRMHLKPLRCSDAASWSSGAVATLESRSDHRTALRDRAGRGRARLARPRFVTRPRPD